MYYHPNSIARRQMQSPWSSNTNLGRYNYNTRNTKTAKSTRPGFPNIGQSCFMNALLQALLCLPTFIKFLEKSKLNSDTPNTTTILKIIAAEAYSKDCNKSIVNGAIRHLYDYCMDAAKKDILKSETLTRGRQNDAHEMYSLIIDLLHTENADKRQHEIVYKNKDVSDSNIYVDAWNAYLALINREGMSAIKKHVFGGLVSTIECPCGYKSDTHDVFGELSLAIPDSPEPDLLDMLGHFRDPYMLDDATCSACGKKGTLVKTMSISIMPQILVVHIKRFEAASHQIGRHTQYYYAQSGMQKRDDIVKVPESLDLYMDLHDDVASVTKMNSVYTLKSVIHHTGRYGFGHYYTTGYDPKTKEYLYLNDSMVFPKDRHSVSTRTGYIAFYERNPGKVA